MNRNVKKCCDVKLFNQIMKSSSVFCQFIIRTKQTCTTIATNSFCSEPNVTVSLICSINKIQYLKTFIRIAKYEYPIRQILKNCIVLFCINKLVIYDKNIFAWHKRKSELNNYVLYRCNDLIICRLN